MSTVKEWLHDLANTDTSNDDDSTKMQNLLRRIGFSKAVVVLGIVYPDGYGQPVDIHTMARGIIKEAERDKNKTQPKV